MSDNKDQRGFVIEAWEDLQDMITDYYDDFDDAKLASIRRDWRRYVSACSQAGEPAFVLADILDETMKEIPSGYPRDPATDKPSFVPYGTLRFFDTPAARKQAQK